jgi:hypothetical protein
MRDGERMKALRMFQEVADDGYLHIKVPPEIKGKVELIILSSSNPAENESLAYMKLQEESGFYKTVLAAEAEDVWNEI